MESMENAREAVYLNYFCSKCKRDYTLRVGSLIVYSVREAHNHLGIEDFSLLHEHQREPGDETHKFVIYHDSGFKVTQIERIK